MKWVKPQSLYLQLLMFLGLPLMLLWGLCGEVIVSAWWLCGERKALRP